MRGKQSPRLAFTCAPSPVSTAPAVGDNFPELAKHFPLGGIIGDNGALLPLVLYGTFYIILGLSDGKPVLGFLGASLIAGLVVAANLFMTKWEVPADAPFATVWNVALALHIFAWAVQFYGHGALPPPCPCSQLQRHTHPAPPQVCTRAVALP